MRITDKIRNRTIKHLAEFEKNFKTWRAGPLLVITDHTFRYADKITELFHSDFSHLAKAAKISQEITSKLN